jgi:DeoR/GlpR family transcriptional regulator of sugar metabolism
MNDSHFFRFYPVTCRLGDNFNLKRSAMPKKETTRRHGTGVAVQVDATNTHNKSDARESVNFLERLGKAIKARRDVFGWPQSLLAERSRLTQSQISAIETGRSSPTVESLAALADAFDCKVSAIISQAEASPYRIASILPFSYEARLEQCALAKHFLAEYVAYLFRSDYANQTVGIDGGTTNQFLAEAIGRDAAREHQTVSMIVTNHIGVPEKVRTVPGAPDVFVTSGVYRPDRKTLFGPAVVRSLDEFELAASVIGVNGLKFPSMFTKAGMENDLKNAFIRKSRDIIVPVDPQKWDYVSGSNLNNVLDLVADKGKRVILVGAYPVEMASDLHAADDSRIDQLNNAFHANLRRIFNSERVHVRATFATVEMSATPNDIPKIEPTNFDLQLECLTNLTAEMEQRIRPCERIGSVVAFLISQPGNDD